MQIHLFDYPVILNLLMVRNQIKSLIDFGGHIGVKYYAYKRLLPNINELIWKVVDVPFCVERGRKEASQRGATNLSFSSDILEAGECDLLLISGALQYVTPSIGELLDSMVCFPRLIIINKLPVHFGPDYYTIENFGKAKIPYRIFNKNQFDSQLILRDYNKIDTWTIPSREISIPFYREEVGQICDGGTSLEKIEIFFESLRVEFLEACFDKIAEFRQGRRWTPLLGLLTIKCAYYCESGQL